MQELLKGGDIEDLVGGGLGSIDDELFHTLNQLGSLEVRESRKGCLHTFFVIFAGLPLGPEAGFFYIAQGNT